MSILCKNDRGWVLDHSAFIKNVYCNLNVETLETANNELNSQCCLDENLFKIFTPFLFDAEAINVTKENRLKRKRKSLKLPVYDESVEVCSVLLY